MGRLAGALLFLKLPSVRHVRWDALQLPEEVFGVTVLQKIAIGANRDAGLHVIGKGAEEKDANVRNGLMICCVILISFILGIRTSMMATACFNCPAFCTASRPSPASPTTQMPLSALRMLSRLLRMVRESSAIKTRIKGLRSWKQIANAMV